MIDARLILGVARADRLLVVSDFDGTLAEIVDHHDLARPCDGAIEVLEQLAEIPRTSAAVLSGRSLADLRRRLGSPRGVRLLGSYGLEGGPWESPLTDLETDALAIAVQRLDRVAAEFPGVLVERKSLAVCLHVRRAAAVHADAAVRAALIATRGLAVHPITGSAVVEFCARVPSKWSALRRLMAEMHRATVVYLGDDHADAPVLAALGPPHLAIRVGDVEGPGPRVARPGDAVVVLRELAAARARYCVAP